jgi:hypothetical protein
VAAVKKCQALLHDSWHFLTTLFDATAYGRGMLKELGAVLGLAALLVATMSVLAITFHVDVRILTAVSFLIFVLFIVLFYRRLRRIAPDVPAACHVTAAIALLVGADALIGGVGHSFAVASLTVREPEYGPLQILRLTTGVILLFCGAMTLAMYPGIKAGRRSAVGLGAATALLLWLHLLFTLPLQGTGGTVPPRLGLWGVYLLSLGAAATSLAMGKFKEAEVAR